MPDAETNQKAQAIQIHSVGGVRSRVGEGPLWDAQSEQLRWVDILAGTVHATKVGAPQDTTAVVCPTWIGAVARRTSAGLVAATRRGFAVISADGEYEDRLPFLPKGIRMNDGACDAAGRFWVGSTDEQFAPGEGSLHVLEPDWTHRTVLSGLTLPNGLGWSPDNSTFYLVDSMRHVVRAFDFDLAAAALRNGRTFATFDPDHGLPDGLCVDSDGAVWIAIWSGARIERYSAVGELTESVALPVAQPTSCAFGGAELATLFVTSAHEGLDVADDSLDGAVLAITGLSATGKPTYAFAG
jgi:sugar lactone lactonase YvrE